METTTISRALGLAEDASYRDILERIAALKEAAGEESVDGLTDRDLLIRGEHERVSINSDGSATVSLYYPIMSGKEPLTELTFRRPKAKDLRKLEESKGGELGQTFAMIASLSKRALSEIDDLDSADVALCSMVVGFLRRPPRRTGSSS